MPHPQDVAVPSLPLSETLALAIKLGVANVDFEEQAEIDGFLHTFGNACYEAGRAAGRASAEPEQQDWRTHADVLVDIYFDGVNHAPEHRCYVDGALDAAMARTRAALAAAPTSTAIIPMVDDLPGMWEPADFIGGETDCTPTASSAPKAEGEAHQIITLCGSARFERLFKAWNEALTMAGHTVFGLTAYPSDKAGVKQWYSDEQKAALDAAHFRKIEASDAIFVINRNAYIGHSTMNEIEHARKHGKAIYFLESWGKGNGPIDSASPIDTTTRSGSRCPWSSRLLGPAGAVRNAIVKLTRGAESDAAPGAQAAAAAVKLPDVSELLVWAVEDDLLRMSKIMDADLQDALVAYSKRILALALSPRPSADADRASGGGVDTERLNWLLANPNTVLEDAGNEWFILDADSEPTYFKSGREAIDAARATPTTKD